MPSALSAAALPICHGLGQAPNNGGLLIIIILYAKLYSSMHIYINTLSLHH